MRYFGYISQKSNFLLISLILQSLFKPRRLNSSLHWYLYINQIYKKSVIVIKIHFPAIKTTNESFRILISKRTGLNLIKVNLFYSTEDSLAILSAAEDKCFKPEISAYYVDSSIYFFVHLPHHWVFVTF